MLSLLSIVVVVILSGIMTVPLSIALLSVFTVIYKRAFVFYLAFGLGFYLDLIYLRELGYSSLLFTLFVFLIRLYERKFETKTATFVFISTFLGSLMYLLLINYQQALFQSLINSILGILTFRLIQNSKFKNQNYI